MTQDSYAIDGRVFALPSSSMLEGHEVRPFVRRARKALQRVDPAGELWLPCPTRSRFVIPPLP